MGIQDRDYYREQYRNVSSPRRPKPPSTGRLALFWIAVLAITFAVIRFAPTIWPRAPAVAPPPVSQPSVQQPSVPAPQALSTLPTAPRAVPYDGGRPTAPPATEQIYRCGSRYGHEPCAGGRAIDGPAATGFDSRPSERLARLIAEGRAAGGDSVTTSTTTIVRNGAVDGADRIGACRALATEIADIDREARQPLSARRQDWLRARRADVRDQQVALHC